MGGNAPKAKASQEGLLFPRQADGNVSTSKTGKQALAAAIGDLAPGVKAELLAEKDWRFGYFRHFVELVALQSVSKEHALSVAQRGLEWMHDNFLFAREGQVLSVKDAMRLHTHTGMNTGKITGTQTRNRAVQVEYKGKILEGDALNKQMKAWRDFGVVEPSAAEAMATLIEQSDWCDLDGRVFVLMGAGAAMGPLLTLLRMGATVVAIDLPRPAVWKRLFKIAQESAGTLLFPLQKELPEDSTHEALAEVAGCNLLTQTPEIRNWLLQLETGKQMTLGAYCYSDGEAHVRVSLAMDAIQESLLRKRSDVSLAFLCSPTDVFMIPAEARAHSRRIFRSFDMQALWRWPLTVVSGGRLLGMNEAIPKSNAKDQAGTEVNLVDNIIVQQGPSYTLAKRLQQWRAVLAQHQGHVVSCNVAPASSTPSVISNPILKAAYGGSNFFEPIEIFEPETASTLMSALLLYDLNARPELSHPLQLFQRTACHGGMWRMAYKLRTEAVVSALLYWAHVYRVGPVVGAATAVGAGLAIRARL